MDIRTILNAIIKVYPLFTWIGTFILICGILVSAIVYRGKEGERYSIGNHFISELGETGTSRLAFLFNFAMIAGGMLYLPMMVGLGLALDSTWGKLGMAAGIIAAVSCVFVGVFPMSNLTPHRIAAMTYFRFGLVTVLLFTIAVLVQPAGNRVLPLYTSFFGLLSVLTYSTFLFIVGRKMDKNKQPNYILDPKAMPERPRFWRTAFWEWMVFFTTILWFVIMVTNV